MVLSPKLSFGWSYRSLVKHRRNASRIIFINCVVLAVFTAAVFNLQHFKQKYSWIPHSRDSQHEISYTQKEYTKPTTATKDTIDPKALFNIPPVPPHSETDFVSLLQPSIMKEYLQYKQREYNDTVVILTPIHNVARRIPKFAKLLKGLTYPQNLISVVFGEDCSDDGTLTVAKQVANDLRTTFKNADVLHFNITGSVGGTWSNIHMKKNQLKRRAHLAQSRNLLMKGGLKNATWALWIDSDITYLPPDIIQQLMSSGKDIVVPACLYNSDGRLRVFDKNTWRETPESIAYQKTMPPEELMVEGYSLSRRIFITDLRAEGRVVPIDGVGGCTLLVKGDHHRNGLVFPETILDHHIETEGLAKLAKKMGLSVYGMPFVEVLH